MTLTPEVARSWFSPRSILVAGASTQRTTLGNVFLRRQREFGYAGRLHVLHGKAAEIEGADCIRSLDDIDEPIDYAYVAIPGAEVVRLLGESRGRIRVAQVVSSGFREIGPEGRALEADMIRAARAGGVRLVGPNCMGSYSPGSRLTMIDGAPPEPGDIGVVSQSGVLACDVIKLGAFSGGRFSQVLSIGNCADIDAVEVYEHFVTDPSTRVIGLYVEGLDRGEAFIGAIREAEGRKPTVVLKGGVTDQGQRSVSSHTGALASDGRIWRGLAEQFGLALPTSIEGFAASVVGASFWSRTSLPAGRRCCLIGPGGILSVLGTDILRGRGLDVPELSPGALGRLRALGLPPGSSVRNPIDTPVGVMEAQGGQAFGKILHIIAESLEVDWFVVHVSIQNLFSFLGDPETALTNCIAGMLSAASDHGERARWALVLRTNRDPALEPVRTRLCRTASGAGVPTFTTLQDAAAAVSDFVRFSERASTMAKRRSANGPAP